MNKNIFWLAISVAVAICGLGISIPILPFLIKKLDGNDFQASFIFAVFSFFSLVFSPFWGRMADKYGRKKIMLTSLIMTAISYIIVSNAHEIWHIYFGRAMAGLFAGWMSIAQAIVLSYSNTDNRAKHLGILGASFGMGYTLGPGVGAVMLNYMDLQDSLLISGLCNLLAFSVILLALKSQPIIQAIKKPWINLLKNRQISKILFVYFSLLVAFNAMESSLALWGANRLGYTSKEIGYLLVLAGMIAIFVQGGILGKLTQIFSSEQLIKYGLPMIGLGLFFLIIAHNDMMAILAIICLSLGSSLCTPSILAVLSKQVGDESYGALMGMAQSIQSGSRVVGASFFGYIYYVYGYEKSYSIAILVILIAFVSYNNIIRNNNNQSA